jgi:hypothetical protein
VRPGRFAFSMLAALASGTITTVADAGTFAQDPAQGVELSQSEIEMRVKSEAARRLGVRSEEVRLVELKPRIWPDAGLGCNARRGVLDPSPVHGFRIVTEAGGRQLVYHTDRHGRVLRCAPPSKPIDRIK